jgi:hypothetical protein
MYSSGVLLPESTAPPLLFESAPPAISPPFASSYLTYPISFAEVGPVTSMIESCRARSILLYNLDELIS